MIPRRGQGTQGWRRVGPGQQGVTRAQSRWRQQRQRGRRGSRSRRRAGLGRRWSVAPEVLEQLVRVGEPFAAVDAVAADVVAPVGHLRGSGQGHEVGLGVGRVRRGRGRRRSCSRCLRRSTGIVVIALGATGCTGTARRRSRLAGRGQFGAVDR